MFRRWWRENSPGSCVRMCSAAGYSFAGVEWGRECYCGHDPPTEDTRSHGKTTFASNFRETLLYIHTYLSSNIFHKYHQYTLSISKVESFA